MALIYYTASTPKTGLGTYSGNVIKYLKENQKFKIYQFVYKKNSDTFKGIRCLKSFTNSWFVNDLLNIPEKRLISVIDSDTELIHFGEPLVLPRVEISKEFKNQGIKLVATIHDLIDPIMGNLNYYGYEGKAISFIRTIFSKDHKNKTIQLLDRLALMDRIVTISNNTKRDLLILFALRGIYFPPQNIIPIHYGIDHIVNIISSKEDARKEFGLSEKDKILLNVSSEEPRKNNILLYRTLKLLGSDYKLIKVGRILEINRPLAKTLINEGRLLQMYKISDEKLAKCYAAADLYIFPSLYEGFGLPPLEAMNKGVPTLSMVNSSLAEVVGNAVVKLDDTTTSKELKKKIESTLLNNKLCNLLSKKGLLQSRKFTWNKNIDALLKVYKSIGVIL